MKKLLTLLAIPVFAALAAMPAAVQAHGTLFTFQYLDGPHYIMVTHNVHEAQAGVSVTYNLRLYTIEGQLAPFQTAEAAVTREARTLHRETITANEYGEANLKYAYPAAGTYNLRLTFLVNGKHLARGAFPITVAPGPDRGFWDTAFTVQTGAAALLGAGLYAAVREGKRLRLGRRLLRRQ